MHSEGPGGAGKPVDMTHVRITCTDSREDGNSAAVADSAKYFSACLVEPAEVMLTNDYSYFSYCRCPACLDRCVDIDDSAPEWDTATCTCGFRVVYAVRRAWNRHLDPNAITYDAQSGNKATMIKMHVAAFSIRGSSFRL